MSTKNLTPPSSAIKRCGTEQPDAPGRILRAGPVSVEFDNGNLRYVRLQGVEVLRAIAYLVRDENWGTYTPALADLHIDQRADSFSVRYSATCARGEQTFTYRARIEGGADGSLHFHAVGEPATDFLTNRTGFVVLHPLKGVAGCPVEVELVDGSRIKDTFPALINPVCPFTDIRALSHEALPGVWAICRMEGEAFEMEDHRNWTDASFKTYVRPLAKPWPYTMPRGEAFEQSVSLRFHGELPQPTALTGARAVKVQVGGNTGRVMPRLGLGMPMEELEASLANIGLVRAMAPSFLVGHFDTRARQSAADFLKLRRVCEAVKADAVLEIIVESVDDFGNELDRVAEMAEVAQLKLSAVAVCPVGDLKAILPGSPRPPAPDLAELYAAARDSFPGVKVGGGMVSFFTELNRKRPPAHALDFVVNTTCPIVHAADDRSVMETLEALPYQADTARSFIGKTPHRVGPSAIGCRDNPHGVTYSPNPDNERVCLAKIDPRQRGLFGAAWYLGYVATLAHAGVAEISLGTATGPLGFIYRAADHKQPWFDQLGAAAVYPAFHVVAGLTKATGSALVAANSSEPQSVLAFAHRHRRGVRLWLANLTATDQTMQLAGLPRSNLLCRTLDEASFAAACTQGADAAHFQGRELEGNEITLGAYAVACIGPRET